MKCQLHLVPRMADPLGGANRFWQVRNRLKRMFKRRMRYLINSFNTWRLSAYASEARELQVPGGKGNASQSLVHSLHVAGSSPGASRLTPNASESSVLSLQSFKPGDLVRVRSRHEIEGTLNQWNQLKGCSFVEEMWSFCGTEQKVLRRVEKFLDERDYLMKKCKGILILDGIMCQGTKDFGLCDRSCFYFWREEWLGKTS